MGEVDITKLQATSGLPGLTTIGKVTGQTTFSGTIPDSGSLTTTLPLFFTKTNVISQIRINVTGGNLGSLWFPLTGFVGLFDALTLSPLANAYYMLFLVNASASGRTINIEFLNQRVSGTLALPTLTINAVANLYSYPW